MDTDTALAQASWIWLPQEAPTAHQYVCFRRTFALVERPEQAILDLSVDSDFVLYVNGAEAGRGQFSDYPERKTFTRIDLATHLKPGDNTLAVLAYYRGEDFFEYRKGEPGLILALTAGTVRVSTDALWKAIVHPAFASGPMPRVTPQMGFTTSFDAREDIPWTEPGFKDESWASAEVVAPATGGFWREILPRPVPPLTLEAPSASSVAFQGKFIRTRERDSTAETMAHDALVPRSAAHTLEPHGDAEPLVFEPPSDGMTGRFAVIDVGCEEVGLLTLEMEAPAGTVLEVGHGEHLDDGAVRMWVGKRNFADRYVCGEGRRRYVLPFRRLGARYLQIHASGFTSAVRLHYAGLTPTRFPVEEGGGFSTPDALARAIYEVSVRTMELCMHEHYEDCPWREQANYAYDSRHQALFGYYTFGNYAFAEASFDLTGRGYREEDGLLELAAPAKYPVTIPIESLVWIAALAEHWLHSGSSALYERFAGEVTGILDKMIARRDPATGLYRPPGGPGMWHHYEWSAGLSGEDKDDVTHEHHAAFNLYLHESLGSTAWMLAQSGDHVAARQMEATRSALGAAIDRWFWNENGYYATRLVHGRQRLAHDNVQLLALHEGLVPKQRQGRVLETLYAGGLQEAMLAGLMYLVRGLMPVDEAARRFVSATVAKHWEMMLRVGATSFWETQRGGDDFSFAGSLCHGWGGLPAYYYQAWVLGIRPLEPGFRRFIVSPYPDRFWTASGAIPTPLGPITVEWRRIDDGLALTAKGPEELTPVLEPLPEAPVIHGTYNRRPLV